MAISGLIIFMLLGLFAQANAQIKIVLGTKGDSLAVAWSHDWKDVNGQDERVASFALYVSRNDSAFVYAGSVYDDAGTGKPKTSCTYRKLQQNSKYVFGVVAVDYAGNASQMHTSLMPTAAYNGWYIIIDTIPPRMPSNMRPNN